MQTPGGRVSYDGDTRIDGVPEPAAPVKLNFLDAMGSMTGRLLPTGNVVDVIDGVEASCVDMAMPVVIMSAEALGKDGAEAPAELDADRALFARLDALRRSGGSDHGLGRRRQDRGAQAGDRLAAARRRQHHLALLHTAQLPPVARRHRRHRRRHRRSAARHRREPLR